MPNPQYRAGNHFERRVADKLRDDGYQTWQTRNSRTPADLIAAKPRQLLLVQVKAGVTGPSDEEWNALYHLAAAAGAVPLIARRGHNRAIIYHRITGTHTPRSHTWPATPWHPDEVDLAAAIERHPAGRDR